MMEQRGKVKPPASCWLCFPLLFHYITFVINVDLQLWMTSKKGAKKRPGEPAFLSRLRGVSKALKNGRGCCRTL
jgi:hypothetical protein